MGGAGLETEKEKRQREQIEKGSLPEEEKLKRLERLRQRTRPWNEQQVEAIAADLEVIQSQLSLLNNATPTTHQNYDPYAPGAPSGTDGGFSAANRPISSYLNDCLNYLEEFATSETSIKHTHGRPASGSGTYHSYLPTFVGLIKKELSRPKFPGKFPPSNPPKLKQPPKSAQKYDLTYYQPVVDDIDWIFQRLSGMFPGAQVSTPKYIPGMDPDLLLQEYCDEIVKMFTSTP